MSYKLKNPPIIEAWIQATTTPAPESEWDWGLADQVLQSFGGELDVFEHLPSYTPEAKKFDKDKRPTEIQIHVQPRYLRVRDKQRSEIIQIGHNELMVTNLRQNDSVYPGFERLLASFLNALSRYCQHLPVADVQGVELHYVDLVVIPELFSGEKELHDLFVGAPKLPGTPFGGQVNASWSLTFAPAELGVVVQLSVQMQAPDEDEGRFRMDWHCWCGELGTLDQETIAARLRLTHNYVLECFQAVIQPRVWSLFGPITQIETQCL